MRIAIITPEQQAHIGHRAASLALPAMALLAACAGTPAATMNLAVEQSAYSSAVLVMAGQAASLLRQAEDRQPLPESFL